LAPFQMLGPTRMTHERAAHLRDRCLRAGVTVSTVDVLIAQVAIDFSCALLSADRDFRMIAKYSALRVLESA
jgi:predicted nucleic acid-binding protein